MSLHKTSIAYRGMTLWLESEKDLEPYRAEDIEHQLRRDFTYMLRAAGVHTHFEKPREKIKPL